MCQSLAHGPTVACSEIRFGLKSQYKVTARTAASLLLYSTWTVHRMYPIGLFFIFFNILFTFYSRFKYKINFLCLLFEVIHFVLLSLALLGFQC